MNFDENDPKRRKFIKLAENRVNNTLKYIHRIGNLSNKVNYKYAQADIDKIFSTLHNELEKAREKFEVGLKDNKSKFTLKD